MGLRDDYSWLFLYNLKFPLLFFTIAGVALCAGVAFWSFRVRRFASFASPEYVDAQNRLWICLHAGVILSAIYILISAIPAPDYDVRIVTRTIIQRVPMVRIQWRDGVRTIPDPYQALFNNCMDHSFHSQTEDIQACHQHALEASRVAPQIIWRFRPVTYKDIFDDCNDHNVDYPRAPSDGSAGDPRIRRDNRLQLCHQIAMQASSNH